MIKVLFDHQIFSKQIYGGIPRYFANIIKSLQKSEDVKAIKGILYSISYYQKAETHSIKIALFKLLTFNKTNIYQRNNRYCTYLIIRNNFDILHATYYDPYCLRYLKKPLVITIHDMIYERFPQLFPPNDPTPQQKREVAQAANVIIAISETTKKDIIKYLDIAEDKIRVIYHGIDTNYPQYETVDHLPERYILFVGSRGGYKNFQLVADAFKELSKTDETLHLVIVGGGDLTTEEVQFFRTHQILEKTLHLIATDEQLNTLYKNAICFIFPSLYEGFGLPILEAFKNNCPILLSNCSCFPEIAGDAALYFEPESLQSLIDKVNLIQEDVTLRNDLIASGALKLQTYTLDKCMEATTDLYKELAGNNKKAHQT